MRSLAAQLAGVVMRATGALTRYADGWRKHETLWKQEKGVVLDKFVAQVPTTVPKRMPKHKPNAPCPAPVPCALCVVCHAVDDESIPHVAGAVLL